VVTESSAARCAESAIGISETGAPLYAE